MAMDAKAEKSSMPSHAIPKAAFSDKDANGLTKCIVAFLTLSGGYAVRINVQGQWNESLGRFTKSQTRKGTADIHACYKGRHISIEVKHGKDKMSKEQIATKNDVHASGGFYMIARSFQTWYDEFVELDFAPELTLLLSAIEFEAKTATSGTEEAVLKRLYLMLSKWLENKKTTQL